MADVTLPAPERAQSSWLDRPLLPTWQRLAAVSVNWELAAYGTIVLVGFLLRIWDVGTRALHHDESLHAYYAWKFFVGQGYAYNPLMHGPLQFEVVPLFYLVFGDNEMAARMLAVVLGTVLVLLPFYLRRYLTPAGALLASAMLAISPAFVYFSRFIRDDMYLACFALVMFIGIVKYLEQPKGRYLYLVAAAAALAVASMEAAYLTLFIFGTFVFFEGLREYVGKQPGPVLRALRATSLDTWLTAISVFVVITVLLYSTLFTNPYGIWDTSHSLFGGTCNGRPTLLNPARQDILGGIFYWQCQHNVQRGGQPWFYYLLVLPLYEQLALLFGLAGLVYAAIHRTLVTTFLAWWAVLAFAVYTWAGEKMPWLSIHIALPLYLLAGLFLGHVLHARRTWQLAVTGAVFILLFALEVHSTFLLNFVDGANPTEMLIYVQSSQDVVTVTHEVDRLAARTKQGYALPIGLDSSDVGGWPFTWYLRNYTNVTETSSFSGPTCGGQYCPVLLMLGPEYDRYGPQLNKQYIAQKYRWNWWFPEDYKVWFPQQWAMEGQALRGHGSLTALLGTPTDWNHVWNWLIYRTPYGPRDARWLYFLVRRDLVPGGKSLPIQTTSPTSNTGQTLPSISASIVQSLGATGVGAGQLTGPRGVGAGPSGALYIADTLNHRVVEYLAGGKRTQSWGSAGSRPGQFASRDSPQSLGVASNGDVYVADTWNQRIEVFNSSGRFLRAWGGGPIGSRPGQFFGPRSVAVSSAGTVYVADTGNKRIQVFSKTGKYLLSWGSAGTNRGQFDEPSSVAAGPDGVVYVADFWNRRIQAFSPRGTFLREWPVPDWTQQSYDEPYLAVDSRTGNVFATDPQQRQVLEYTNQGRLIGAFGSGQISLPIGVAVLPSGHVAVTDATANRVTVFAVNVQKSSGSSTGSVTRRTVTPKKP